MYIDTWEIVIIHLIHLFVLGCLLYACWSPGSKTVGESEKPIIMTSNPHLPLASLTAAKTDDLAVLLQLGDELVTLLDDVIIPGMCC
jgi:hypothetical protein